MVGIGWSTCWGKCVWILLPWAPLITWSTLGGGSGQGESCKVVFFILGKFSHFDLQALGINGSSTTAVIECLVGMIQCRFFSNILSRWHCGSYRDRGGSWKHSPYCVSRRKKRTSRGDGPESCHFFGPEFWHTTACLNVLATQSGSRRSTHTICGSRTQNWSFTNALRWQGSPLGCRPALHPVTSGGLGSQGSCCQYTSCSVY